MSNLYSTCYTGLPRSPVSQDWHCKNLPSRGASTLSRVPLQSMKHIPKKQLVGPDHALRTDMIRHPLDPIERSKLLLLQSHRSSDTCSCSRLFGLPDTFWLVEDDSALNLLSYRWGSDRLGPAKCISMQSRLHSQAYSQHVCVESLKWKVTNIEDILSVQTPIRTRPTLEPEHPIIRLVKRYESCYVASASPKFVQPFHKKNMLTGFNFN